MAEPRGWHWRGYLPHFDDGEVAQAITFRLADSLPRQVLAQWQDELAGMPDGERKRRETARAERYLDTGYGACWLRRPAVAGLVQDALRFHHERSYRLLAWVVMPNHVHAVLVPRDGVTVSSVLHSIKSYTSHRANAELCRDGRFWQPDYYDRFVRSDRHLAAAIEYVESNPVAAGLCGEPGAWAWSSAGCALPSDSTDSDG